MIHVDSKAKGLIFDLDGTLIDSMPIHKIAWMEICAAEGFDFTDEIFYKYAGVPSEKIFEILNSEYGTTFNPEYHSSLKEDVYSKMTDQVKIIPEVFEVVKHYHGKIPLSIGTGSPRAHSLEIVKHLGLDKFIDILVAKDDVENGKPAPDTFLKCADLMGVLPSECIVFEDGDAGIEAAERAGMIFIDIRKEIA